MVCVLYTGGERYCDVRSQQAISFMSREECETTARESVIKIAENALGDEEDVVAVIGTYSSCAGDIKSVLRQVAMSGASFTHTEY